MIWMINTKLTIKEVLLFALLCFIKLLCIRANTMQAKLLHNGWYVFFADMQTIWDQDCANLFRTVTLLAVIKDLLDFQCNLKEQFYQTKNIEFLKKTLGRELWVQVSGSKDINGASAAFWAALMPVENIDEAYRDYSWNSYIGTQCPGFIEYGDKITYEANPLNFDSCLNIVQYREFYGIKPNYVEISEEFRLLNNLYHDINTNIFYEIEENGECTEVAKIINNDCAYDWLTKRKRNC